MKIKRVYIKNFKAIGPEEVCFDFSENMLVLIGENNVGKSSVLSALDIFFENTKKIPPDLYYNHNKDQDNAITITVVFSDLTELDRDHMAVRSYISQDDDSEDVWVLKKRYYYTDEKNYVCEYATVVDGEDRDNPTGRQTNVDDLFTDEKMQKIRVPAVLNVEDVTDGSKKTTFSRIVQLLLSEELQGTEEYNNLIKALDAYAALFNSDAKHTKVQEIEAEISDRVKRIINAAGLIDAEMPPHEKLLPTPTLYTNDGRDILINPSLQGHGLQRSVIFALLELYAESMSAPTKEVGVKNLILIEEPEIYMHPQMVRRITDVLYRLADSDSVQVICTTHSPVFIRAIEKPQSLARITRSTGNSFECTQVSEPIFGETKNDKEEKNKLSIVSRFDPHVNELFFAKRVVLLEGDTEYAVFPLAADLLGVFDGPGGVYKKQDTTIINCRSRDFIPSFQRVLNHFQIPYVVIHDLEGETPCEGVNGRILELLDGDKERRRTFDPEIETVLGVSTPGTKWFKAVKKIRELHDSNNLESTIGDYVKYAYGLE